MGLRRGVGRAARGPVIGAALVVPPCARRGFRLVSFALRLGLVGLGSGNGGQRGGVELGGAPSQSRQRGVPGRTSLAPSSEPRRDGTQRRGGRGLRALTETERLAHGAAGQQEEEEEEKDGSGAAHLPLRAEPRPQALHLEAGENFSLNFAFCGCPAPIRLRRGRRQPPPQRRSPWAGGGDAVPGSVPRFPVHPSLAHSALCRLTPPRLRIPPPQPAPFFSNLPSPSAPPPLPHFFCANPQDEKKG